MRPSLLLFSTLVFLAIPGCSAAPSAALLSATRTVNVPAPRDVSPEEEQFGHELLETLTREYELRYDQRYEKLQKLVARLTEGIGVDTQPWHVFLLDAPDEANARGVHGNHLFVWSGLFTEVRNDDELAGILAQELAHILSRHTEPFTFHPAAEALMAVGSIATSLAISYASQGVVTVNAPGLYRWMIVEAMDLGPLDREYEAEEEVVAHALSVLMLRKADLDPLASWSFWRRAGSDRKLSSRLEPLIRDMPPEERARIIFQASLEYAQQDPRNTTSSSADEWRVDPEKFPSVGTK